MTDKTDKTLEEFLDGRSSVSRGYAELGDEQPPAALDRRILAAANSAVAREEDATVIRVRRWRKWSVSAALAATVVVAVPLVVRTIDLGINEQASVPERQTVASKSDSDASLDLVTPDTLVEEPQPAAAAAPQSTATSAAAEKRRGRVADGFDAPSAPADRASMPDDLERHQADISDDAASVAVISEAQAAGLADNVAAPRADLPDKEETRVAAEMAWRTKDAPREDDLGFAASSPAYPDQRGLIERIATLYRTGQTRAAQLEFGEFLVLYPEAELPDDFPLQRSEAIQPQRRIIREADEWLRSIAMLADESRIDAARQELARFFERYPDYELPGWFPLTRDDAAPIER